MFKKTIAVIGGGSVGVSYVYQLIEEAIQERMSEYLNIILFEPQGHVGPGHAYQADFECNLLNTRADSMSAVANDKKHFMKWLDKNNSALAADYPDTKIDASGFLPRSLFGRYLADHFESACTLAKIHGIALHHIKDEATDIIPLSDETICIDTRNSGAHIADRAVLCRGNLPATNFSHLKEVPGFFNSPYPTQMLSDRIPKKASVCILGTGLSAIDAVLSLVEGGHRGKIVCTSRNGRLPSVRGIFNKPRTLDNLTREKIDLFATENGGSLKLEHVFSVLQQEVEKATGTKCNLNEIMNPQAGIFDYISSEIVLSEKTERLWQSVIYSTNSVIDYVWHRLSTNDKRLFQKTFGSLWSSYRVSFPVKNAQKLRELLRTDRIIVFGGAKTVNFNEINNVFETRIHDEDAGFRTIVESEYLINATGFSTDVSRTEEPLIQNILKRRLAVANEFGGFNLDFESGRVIRADGVRSSNISVLGSLASGTYFWTNAMDVNARLAKGQAKDAIKAIKATNHEPVKKTVESIFISQESEAKKMLILPIENKSREHAVVTQ